MLKLSLIRGVSWNPPKKQAKDDFIMWKQFHNFLKCLKIELFHFGSFSVLKLFACQFFEMPHFNVFDFLKCPIFPTLKKLEHKKVGHFQKLAHDQFLNRRGTENDILRILGTSKNYEIAIIKSFMIKSSFTCFLGHFMIPLVHDTPWY